MSTAAPGAKPYYFVPQPSHWPIVAACALLLMGTGAAFWFNQYPAGPWIVLAGFCVLGRLSKLGDGRHTARA